MLTTIKEYCTIRGVSRQFVYKYIKLGKFQLMTLPIYTELNGQRINIGTENFLKVPDGFEPEDLEIAHVQLLAFRATKDKELRQELEKLFLIEDDLEAEHYRDSLYKKYDHLENPKKQSFLDALQQIEKQIEADATELQQSVKDLKYSVEKYKIEKQSLVLAHR
jgi:predicted DNA-binding transcriptional regulator YafY